MSSKFLPVTQANAQYDIDHAMPSMLERNMGWDSLVDICKKFRQHGICSLFLEAAAKNFHTALQKSGALLLHILPTIPNESKITSQQTAFFDAVACGDFETAKEISKISRMTFNPDEEYEDDFLYVMILMKKFFLNASEQEVKVLFQKYQELSEASGETRVDICAAFIENNAEQFEKALNDLIKTRAKDFKERLAKDEILEEAYSTEGQLFVEGLALVRLANKLNFPTQKNYKFIPSLIIEKQATDFGRDSWRTPLE